MRLDILGGRDKRESDLEETEALFAAERTMAMDHSPDCYGAYHTCISCGCSKGAPCVSHQGSPKHQAHLMERIAIALEKRSV